MILDTKKNNYSKLLTPGARIDLKTGFIFDIITVILFKKDCNLLEMRNRFFMSVDSVLWHHHKRVWTSLSTVLMLLKLLQNKSPESS